MYSILDHYAAKTALKAVAREQFADDLPTLKLKRRRSFMFLLVSLWGHRQRWNIQPTEPSTTTLKRMA